jgi:hypothetical protein
MLVKSESDQSARLNERTNFFTESDVSAYKEVDEKRGKPSEDNPESS